MTFETLIKILDALKQDKTILIVEESWEGSHAVTELRKDNCITHYQMYFTNPRYNFVIYEENKHIWEMEVL